MKNIIQNKKALSEIVSYVLLITIALSLAVGVYSFMKFYVPSENEAEKCSSDVALAVNDYNCNNNVLSLIIENRGLFDAAGFIIRASDDSDKIPTSELNTTDKNMHKIFNPGFYDFYTAGIVKLSPGKTHESNFSYSGLDSIARITIQPYTLNKAGDDFLLCETITDLKLKGC